MKSKPMRKNAHKDRIFTLRQNIQDFHYIRNHQEKVDGKNPKILENKDHHCCGENCPDSTKEIK